MAKPAVLLIGGLDPQGCAGISADVQTVSTHDCHAVPLVTCLTEQTSQGLTHTGALTEAEFMGQYQACIADFDIAAIKIGLIPNITIARCISNIIDQHDVPIVLDPVLASTSGGIAVAEDVQQFILQDLLGKTTLLTPNLPELATLTQSEDVDQIEHSTIQLLSKGLAACLVKGGHADSKWASDYFNDGDNAFYCYQEKLNKDVRGTGCVLASSIASQLAHGQDSRDAIVLAKAYLNQGIRQADELGCYSVFKHSMAALQLEDLPKLCYDPKLIGKQFNFPACPNRLGIYPVVDSSEWIDKLIHENIKTIQLRIKDVSAVVRQQEIKRAVSLCDESIAFFVNDYWQTAIDEKAYGVHLGQEDLHDANLIEIEQAGLRLGISTHSYWELSRALAVNPSYIALGPVFETTSKQMPFTPQGIERVKLWTQLLGDKYPLVAIGGIDQQRAEVLKQTGVGSVAMISAITKAVDYRTATKQLINCWQK
ncbi:thiamine monophosphate synthase [Methylophaga sp. 42_25_T18]|nr:thiamine monophosphate synthase [Methylophaga sp. 42_25_T18]OUR87627.1 thiamine monophosphate synthase [Methylophaga sp. 42_8_T64]